METTIAVKESTVQLLALLKKELEAKSFDETIVKVVQKTGRIPSSRFGSQPQLKKFKREEDTDREV